MTSPPSQKKEGKEESNGDNDDVVDDLQPDSSTAMMQEREEERASLQGHETDDETSRKRKRVQTASSDNVNGENKTPIKQAKTKAAVDPTLRQDDDAIHDTTAVPTPTTATPSTTVPTTNDNNSSKSDGAVSHTTTGASSTGNSNSSSNGWRVKLYQLKPDGSWDDCGTGRILCLYKNRSGTKQQVPPPPSSSSDAWMYAELGEPTLCMYSEPPVPTPPAAAASSSTSPDNKTTSSSPKVLLRTRVLLREAYQRQGENIITWSEPCLMGGSAATVTTTDPNNNTVDLALSFQDNPGCLDIWHQIMAIQKQANEWIIEQSAPSPLVGANQKGHLQQQSPNSPPAGTTATETTSPPSQQHPSVATSHHHHHHAQQQDLNRVRDVWVPSSSSSSSLEHNTDTAPPPRTIPTSRAGGPPRAATNDVVVLGENSHHHPHHHNPPHHHGTQHPAQQQEFEDGVGELAAGGALHHHHHHDPQQPQPQHPQEHQQQQQHSQQQQQQQHHMAQQQQPMQPTLPPQPQLPNPPTLGNLEEIADTIAAVQHIQQRESLAIAIAQNECSYLKSLLSLFPSAEARGDYGSLATLAACVKTILLLNEPSIIELIVADELIFEEVCSTLEYDPDLRDKANHRWFLRERAKFRTVVLMEDEELIASIHRSFRVTYLRDTLLRPTMDESSLSTLSSLQTFTHADVVKGVTVPPATTVSSGSPGSPVVEDRGELLKGSYLSKVIGVFGRELHLICEMEWDRFILDNDDGDDDNTKKQKGKTNRTALDDDEDDDDLHEDPSTVIASGQYPKNHPKLAATTTWKQHLAPQDFSLLSCRMRRRGSLTFLRELFNMVRISLQQSDKDDFFAVLVSMKVNMKQQLVDENDAGPSPPPRQPHHSGKATSHQEVKMDPQTVAILDRCPESSVNLLSLLGTLLKDPNTDVTEKGAVLEILAGITMHDPSLIRRHCLDFYAAWKKDLQTGSVDSRIQKIREFRPIANEAGEVIFQCPPNDILASLLFLLATEKDAGVLLQVSEILRNILEDMMSDHGPIGTGFTDEAESPPTNTGGHPPPEQYHHPSHICTSTDQNQFLNMFYEHYVPWLAAPFQSTMLHPNRRLPPSILAGNMQSPYLVRILDDFEKGITKEDGLLRRVSECAIRSSFAVELFSFCVRAHLYRMKTYLSRSRLLVNVLRLLKPRPSRITLSGDRCLKLAALRFLRAVLSVNDDFYHRHIIQHNLFDPVFETFRANPVGDNLVSSSIVEICDYVHSAGIKPLIEYIVTQHMSATNSENRIPSLEDVSSPYVSTLTTLRTAYENGLQQHDKGVHNADLSPQSGGEIPVGSLSDRFVLSQKAREDQRKFRALDREESYFDSDDMEEGPAPPTHSMMMSRGMESDLHRTPRMLSLLHNSDEFDGSPHYETPTADKSS